MAVSKKTRKPRASAPKNQYSAELTSGQLVMAITFLLVFGLACFLMGVLIGKIDPSLTKPIDIAQKIIIEDSTPASAPSTPAVIKEPAAPTPMPPIKQKDLKIDPETKKVVKPASTIPQAAPIVSTDLSADKPAQAPPKTPAPVPETKPAPAPAPKPLIKEVKPTPPQAPKSAPATKRGWSIQAGAFRTLAAAKQEKARIQPSIPYPIDIINSKGSTFHKLYIGSFKNDNEARKVVKELTLKNPKLAFFIQKPM